MKSYAIYSMMSFSVILGDGFPWLSRVSRSRYFLKVNISINGAFQIQNYYMTPVGNFMKAIKCTVSMTLSDLTQISRSSIFQNQNYINIDRQDSYCRTNSRLKFPLRKSSTITKAVLSVKNVAYLASS